jgi:hypothetical protein
MAGRTIIGYWSLDDMHRTVTVETLAGSKSEHLGRHLFSSSFTDFAL